MTEKPVSRVHTFTGPDAAQRALVRTCRAMDQVAASCMPFACDPMRDTEHFSNLCGLASGIETVVHVIERLARVHPRYPHTELVPGISDPSSAE